MASVQSCLALLLLIPLLALHANGARNLKEEEAGVADTNVVDATKKDAASSAATTVGDKKNFVTYGGIGSLGGTGGGAGNVGSGTGIDGFSGVGPLGNPFAGIVGTFPGGLGGGVLPVGGGGGGANGGYPFP